MNKFTVMSKIAGGAAAALLLYDANSQGVRNSNKQQERTVANHLPDQYLSSIRMDKASAVGNKLKKGYFRWQLDNNILEFFAGIKGYFSGVGGSLVENVLPAGLAAGALLFKKAGRFCALGLVACGITYFARDVMDIGKPKPLKDDF